MANTWVASDHHLFHRNIIKFERSRNQFGTFSDSGELLTADLDALNQAIINAHNSLVSPDDLTYFLGDVCWKAQKAAELLPQMNGRKVLLVGNHDHLIPSFAACFESVHHYLEIKHNGHKLVLMHYPIYDFHGMHNGSIHIHGHVHNGDNGPPRRAFDVAIGGNNLHPYLVDDVITTALTYPIKPHGILTSPNLSEHV